MITFKKYDTCPLWHYKGQLGEGLVWSGKGKVPEIGDTVAIRINNLGHGVVVGYASEDDYLGVMVVVDEVTRPDWHRRQNPDNPPGLLFGAELRSEL